MANRPGYPVTRTPVDLKTVSSLALEEGTAYIVQNRGTVSILWAAAADAPNPDLEDVSFSIRPDRYATMTVGDDPVWVWVLEPGKTASLRMNEA